MKTSELQGAALDWAVAKCEGLDYWHPEIGPSQPEYSTNWSQGGLIIERERIAIWGDNDLYWEAECGWAWAKGPTPLVAAMRAYVALKLGEEVEALNELA